MELYKISNFANIDVNRLSEWEFTIVIIPYMEVSLIKKLTDV